MQTYPVFMFITDSIECWYYVTKSHK